MRYTNYFSEENRVFVSFGGKCSFQCLHCYTFSQNFHTEDFYSIEDIVKNLKTKNKFEIIYVSGYKENFENPDCGIDLVESLYYEFKCHILFTTRNVFNEKQISRISNLNKLMRKENKHLFACVSISANNSYKKIEPNNIIPSPEKRLKFVEQLYNNNIITFLTLRPIYPDKFISTREYLTILEKSYKYCNAVIASGISVDEYILKRLKTFPEKYVSKSKKWAYFDMEVSDVDVSKELHEIEEFCERKVPVFESSIPAINHFYNQQKINK